jgi:hypothetical protein
MAIIRAIVEGERDPSKLAKLRDRRVRASEEEVANSLQGNWREDVLFERKQVVEGNDFYRKQIGACDEQLQKYQAELPDGNKSQVAEGEGAAAQEARRSGGMTRASIWKRR